MRRDHRFGTWIVWGTIPIGFPVSWVAVPGWSRNGYGTSPNLWVQKKFVKFRQNTQNTGHSVRLNSFESFLVTLPSISSETWEMYFWAISGSNVFCDWLFLVFSGVFLETAANFFLVFKVSMILREKFCQQWRLNCNFLFWSTVRNFSLLWGKRFQKIENTLISKSVHYSKATNYIIFILLSFLLFIPFLDEKQNCLHAKLRYK